MGVLIDSSVLIDLERQRIDVADIVRGREAELSFIAVISVSELWHGVHRAPDEPRRKQRAAFVGSIVTRYAVLPVDTAVAEIHAGLWAQLSETGTMIGMNDLWIAATALSHNLALLTANHSEFTRIPGLEVISTRSL